MTTKNSITSQENDPSVSEIEFYENINFDKSKQKHEFYNFSENESLEHKVHMTDEFLEPDIDDSISSIINRIILRNDSILSSKDVAEQIAETLSLSKTPIYYDSIKDHLHYEAAKDNGPILKIREDAYLNREGWKAELRRDHHDQDIIHTGTLRPQ